MPFWRLWRGREHSEVRPLLFSRYSSLHRQEGPSIVYAPRVATRAFNLSISSYPVASLIRHDSRPISLLSRSNRSCACLRVSADQVVAVVCPCLHASAALALRSAIRSSRVKVGFFVVTLCLSSDLCSRKEDSASSGEDREGFTVGGIGIEASPSALIDGAGAARRIVSVAACVCTFARSLPSTYFACA